MTPVRPSSHVPEDATLIYPGQMFGPGLGEQFATIVKINALLSKQNNDATQRYSLGVDNWIQNAVQYKAYGMQVPPPPVAPALEKLEVVFADVAGAINDTPAAMDGLHYAWVWQVPA